MREEISRTKPLVLMKKESIKINLIKECSSFFLRNPHPQWRNLMKDFLASARLFFKPKGILFIPLLLLLISACATESHRTLSTQVVASSGVTFTGVRKTLVVGNFQNRSTYMRGIFSDGSDQLGNQAKTTLKSHLQQTGRFIVVDRENMRSLKRESNLRGETQNLKGAQITISGDVTEFGRRTTGDRMLFGILGSGKRQLAYAKVTLNVINVSTSEIIFSTQGAGEYDLSNREFIGFGSTAGYDATLNGKVLNLAIMDAVNKLVVGLEQGQWN